MKYITKRNSTTGKKLVELEKEMNLCLKAQKKLAKEIGFEKWRQAYFTVAGGISAVFFKEGTIVDKKLWKNVNDSENEWMPRLTSKEGKQIRAKINDLPCVMPESLNKCISDKISPWSHPGIHFKNKTYIALDITQDWKIKMPKDCKEITVTEYNRLFKPGKND